ncbi:MAG: hypothetical protein ABFD75_07115 [Smithella sp.]
MRKGILAIILGLILLGVQAGIAVADINLVQNGGFETGDLTGWSWTGSNDPSINGVITGYQHSGSYSAYFGEESLLGYLSQSIYTTSGQTYKVTFWLQNLLDGTPSEFSVSWNGITQIDLINSSAFPYTEFTFTAVATSDSTPLIFGFRHDPDFFDLDDVKVTAVPLPATFLLFGPCLAGLAMIRRRLMN